MIDLIASPGNSLRAMAIFLCFVHGMVYLYILASRIHEIIEMGQAYE